MGFIDNIKEHSSFKKINRQLRRRGLIPCLDSEWEVHGPHQNMNYQVYLGEAIYKTDGETILVAIFPRSVHEIDSTEDWYKCTSANAIPVIN
jgi:hypothetical protein